MTPRATILLKGKVVVLSKQKSKVGKRDVDVDASYIGAKFEEQSRFVLAACPGPLPLSNLRQLMLDSTPSRHSYHRQLFRCP